MNTFLKKYVKRFWLMRNVRFNWNERRIYICDDPKKKYSHFYKRISDMLKITPHFKRRLKDWKISILRKKS